MKFKIVGIGGMGCSSIETISEDQSGRFKNAELVAITTDACRYEYMNIHKICNCILIGRNTCKGNGAGSDPNLGKHAVIESKLQVAGILKKSDNVIIVTGMGGGTGSGATPVISELCKNEGVNCNAVVTLPFFNLEGAERTAIAHEGLSKLRTSTNKLITIPNDWLVSFTGGDVQKCDDLIIDIIQNCNPVIR